MSATDRLREKAQNEQTSIALNHLLKAEQLRNQKLEAQLAIAVEALEEIGSVNWHYSMSRKIATEALSKIRIQNKSAESKGE